jgi:hypothetical protein
MKNEAKERTDAFELTWSLAFEGPGPDGKPEALRLEYRIHASEEIYVSDRLWDYDRARKRVPDPFGVYRFVHEGSLRLVFAQAPWASNMEPSIVYVPLFSRIRAGETRANAISLKLPIEEYSSLARNVAAPSALEEVPRAYLVMGYRLRSTMDKDPQPPPSEGADVGYVVHDPKLLISSLETDPIPVKRRTGYMPRFPLPGEPPPGPKPM